MNVENPLLQALKVSITQSDITTFSQGGNLYLQQMLVTEKGKSCILALDAYNILSLELIQTAEWQDADVQVLESTFSRRRQLCVDIQTTELLSKESLGAVLAGCEVEMLPDEFPLALLWDDAPISSSIFKLLVKLCGDLDVVGLTASYRVHAVSFTLSKGTLAFSATPGQHGNVLLSTAGASLEMRLTDFIRFATHWEIKPDLVFLVKAGRPCFAKPSDGELQQLEQLVRDAENVTLEAPVPSIVMQEEPEEQEEDDHSTQAPEAPQEPYLWNPWVCPNCGSSNDGRQMVCGRCQYSTQSPAEAQYHAPVEPQYPAAAEPQYLEAEVPAEPMLKCHKCGGTTPESSQTCVHCREKVSWQCTHCTLINKESARICEACAKTREDLLKPAREGTPKTRNTEDFGSKYWKCQQCGYGANMKMDEICYKCQGSKNGEIAETWECLTCSAQNDMSARSCETCGARKQVEAPKDLDTWKCPKCSRDNPSRRTLCEKCYEMKPRPRAEEDSRRPPRTKEPEQLPEEPRGKARAYERTREPEQFPEDLRGKARAYERTREPEEFPEEPRVKERVYEREQKPEPQASKNWLCKKCGLSNRESSRICSTCFSSKQAENAKEPEGWTCAKCGAKNRSSDQLCIGCYSSKGVNRAPEKPSKYEPWICPECSQANGSYDVACRKCGVGKEDSRERKKAAPKEAFVEGLYDARDVPREVTREATREVPREVSREVARDASRDVSRDISREIPKKTAASDNYWTCSSCQSKNYKGDEKCYRCKIPRGGTSESGWMCERCQVKNPETSPYCSKCYSDRPEKWTCKFCQGKNRATSTRCEQCYKSRNAEPVETPKKTCAQCGKRVFGTSELCTLCEMKMPSKTEPPALPKCATCGRSKRSEASECSYCMVEREVQRTPKCKQCGRTVVMRDEEYCAVCRPRSASKAWTCLKCSISNTGILCKVCKKPKPT